MDAILRSPSSVGDLIGYAMRICRQQVLSLIRILLVPSIIELIGKIVLIYGLHILVASGVNKVPVIVQSCSLITVGLIISLAAEFFLTLRQLALVRLYGGFANTPNIAMTNTHTLESPSAASKLTTFTADNAPKSG